VEGAPWDAVSSGLVGVMALSTVLCTVPFASTIGVCVPTSVVVGKGVDIAGNTVGRVDSAGRCETIAFGAAGIGLNAITEAPACSMTVDFARKSASCLVAPGSVDGVWWLNVRLDEEDGVGSSPIWSGANLNAKEGTEMSTGLDKSFELAKKFGTF